MFDNEQIQNLEVHCQEMGVSRRVSFCVLANDFKPLDNEMMSELKRHTNAHVAHLEYLLDLAKKAQALLA